MSKQRAFVKYTKQGRLIPGSLISTTKGGYPSKASLWKEVPVWYNDNLPESYNGWKVTTGGVAGDGKVFIDSNNEFTFVGPNDQESTGWVYISRYFPGGATLSIDYRWTSFDEGISVDRPVYWVSNLQPTEKPGITSSKAEDTPESGVWNLSVHPGQWFSIGIYSSDSCCGRGFLNADINIYPYVAAVGISSNNISFPTTNTSMTLQCDNSNVTGAIYTNVTVNDAQDVVDLFNSNIESLQYGKYTIDVENPNVILLETSQLITNQLCNPGSFKVHVFSD